MSDKIKTGNYGENLAAEYLIKKGFEIIARNYRYRRCEIDIIARKENWTIFVEVKTRGLLLLWPSRRVCRCSASKANF